MNVSVNTPFLDAYSLLDELEILRFALDDIKHLVSSKDISRIDFFLYIVQASIVAVGNDGLTLGLEFLQIIDDLAAEEGGTVFECWFVDDYLGSLGLDALHHALDRALTEVIAIGLHGEAVDTNHRNF